MCEVNYEGKLNYVPVMLTGDALNYYANTAKDCGDFSKDMKILCSWYKWNDHKSRILIKWQSMNITNAISNELEESEISLFRKFVTKFRALQNSLDNNYHTNQFLRDRLLTSIDIPSIKYTLRDRVIAKSQQAVHRIANQLSDKPRSAGTN